MEEKNKENNNLRKSKHKMEKESFEDFDKTLGSFNYEDLITNLDISKYSYFEPFKFVDISKSWIENDKWQLKDESLDKKLELETEINDLKKRLKASLTDLNQVTSDKERKINELNDLREELRKKEKLNHILPRVCEAGRQKLLSDSDFVELFKDAKSCECVVVSIDIRRSTELMLKARKPELFSLFITILSQKLSDVIISNFGIFDKFTGDGILAFFPKFYSGENAIIRAIKASVECHEVFIDHYKNSRNCFNVFINDIGLGIGIDYGTVTLVNTRNELTVVGIPVVYACRMGGANAGDTLLNQPAVEEITKHCENYIKIIETEIVIKNEGTALAYKVELHDSVFKVDPPLWVENIMD